jgi:Methyltransferase domain
MTEGIPPLRRHEFLRALHQLTAPRSYVETGIHKGQSLTLSRVPSIGIDPEFAISSEVMADVHLARTSSDEFFARKDPLAHLPKKVIDLAFIDGMHLAEYALRDYLAVERFTTPASVVVFDDMLPRSIDEAARHRHTAAWTGDVYKAAEALRTMCPDLVVLEVDTQPTGLVVVLTPDATRGGVLAGYDEWLDIALAPDPQDVPSEVLNRTRARDPQKLLKSAGWRQLPRLRTKRASRERVRAAFADVLRDVPVS